MRKNLLAWLLASAICLSSANTVVLAAASGSSKGSPALHHLSSYSTGTSNPDGGAAEIVKFNADNSKMYIVNGTTKTIDIVKINKDGSTSFDAATGRIDVSQMIPGFSFGDITSVDVNSKNQLVAITVQEEDYAKAGAVILLNYDGELIKHISAGVQPDMVTFTADGNYILTADEGEPRNGYAEGAIDPKGSVTIIDMTKGAVNAVSTVLTFDRFDSRRDQLIGAKVILKKGAAPSRDLEPEYITVSADSRTAYIGLQEANSIAALDIASKTFTSIRGLGFKDHLLEKNAIDVIKDKKIAFEWHNLYGTYMPDGIALYEKNGKSYILTANEGDAREWGKYANITSTIIGKQKVDVLKNAEHDGLDADKMYLCGARSFSIWEADTMHQVFDSGSDFERITADRYPKFFNSSNKDVAIDSRSGKKGPEPEDVKVGEIDGQTYAFIGLERIGGVMVYNITEPANAYFVDYINTRDFSQSIAGDVSPEGLCFVPAKKSPTGKPLLLAANEVSGTVAIFELY